jgi:hypothetical protein
MERYGTTSCTEPHRAGRTAAPLYIMQEMPRAGGGANALFRRSQLRGPTLLLTGALAIVVLLVTNSSQSPFKLSEPSESSESGSTSGAVSTLSEKLGVDEHFQAILECWLDKECVRLLHSSPSGYSRCWCSSPLPAAPGMPPHAPTAGFAHREACGQETAQIAPAKPRDGASAHGLARLSCAHGRHAIACAGRLRAPRPLELRVPACL